MDIETADRFIYAPILKWREGEQRALRDLRIPIEGLRPVIELLPTPQQSEPKLRKGLTETRPPRPMDMLTGRAIGKAMDGIARTPYNAHPFYLDASSLASEKVLGGRDAVAEVFEQVVLRGFSAIPVIGVPLDGAPIGRLPAWPQTVCYRFNASREESLDVEAIRRLAGGRRMHLILDFRSIAGAQSEARVRAHGGICDRCGVGRLRCHRYRGFGVS